MGCIGTWKGCPGRGEGNRASQRLLPSTHTLQFLKGHGVLPGPSSAVGGPGALVASAEAEGGARAPRWSHAAPPS